MNTDIDRELAEVESLLRRAAGSMPYPATPDIVPDVRVALQQPAAVRPLVAWRRPAFAAGALVATIVLAVAALLAVPASRTATADFFGLDRISFFEDEGSSPPPPVLSPESFARPSSVDELRSLLDFPILLPAGRKPDAAYLQGEEFDVPYAIFVYEDYDLYQTRDASLQKLISGGASVRELSFDGRTAYWVEAGGHVVESLDAQGRVIIETRRSVDRATLVWQANGITYRLESDLSQEETIQVARSLR